MSHLHTTKDLAIRALLFVSLPLCLAAEPENKQLIVFDEASVDEQWTSVNDGVMGGVSEGGFRIIDDKVLEFYGNLSLENNGGFASIRTRPTDLKLDGYDTIAMRVKGDGRTYYLNLRTAARRTAGSYRASFDTVNGVWQEVRVGLQEFEYTAYGRRIPTAESLVAGKVRSVGFTLSDKKSGPFQLQIGWIKAERAAAPSASTTRSKVDNPAGSQDIVDTAVGAGKFKTLLAAVQTAGLVETLKGKGPFTVFAPTDEAFAKLPEGRVDELLRPENRNRLTALLSYHVIAGKLYLSRQSPATLEGQSLAIRTSGLFEVNGARVMASDIAASNGVIHIIDSVLVPPPAQRTPRAAAAAVIELAITRGVPLFNAGQASACAAIYEVAAESLLNSYTSALSEMDRSVLLKALREIRGSDDGPQQQAWTLRLALDRVFDSVSKD